MDNPRRVPGVLASVALVVTIRQQALEPLLLCFPTAWVARKIKNLVKPVKKVVIPAAMVDMVNIMANTAHVAATRVAAVIPLATAAVAVIIPLTAAAAVTPLAAAAVLPAATALPAPAVRRVPAVIALLVSAVRRVPAATALPVSAVLPTAA